MQLLVNTFFLSFQIAALIAAIWYWHSYKHSTERYFLWFMIYVVIHEVVGLCYTYFTNNLNDIIYNVFTLVSFLFYFFWFSKILRKRLFLIPVLLSIFLIFYLYDLFDKDVFYNLYLNPIITGSFCILTLTISYFVELLNTNTIMSFASSQRFWIVTGLFSFYIGLIPLLIFHRFLNYGGNFYSIVITVLNAVLYGCIFKSFLCLRKKP
ncbi:hypothetical protein EZY14_015400 [Kordia sp. TARA_039_SRF]|nr:hypothetical protein EZY14_015400 [Kordia sp. TARA_039_SRF]